MRLFAVALALALTGCASLLLKPDDHWYTKTGKMSARIFLGITTLGISEIEMEAQKRRRAEAEYVGRLQWQIDHWRTAAIEAEADAERQRALEAHTLYVAELENYYRGKREAAALAAAILLSRPGGAYPQPRQPIHCTSTIIGNTVTTNCY